MEPKGLSTIIATLLIVVITIAIFGFAWLFIYSDFFSRTSQTFDIIDSQGTTLTIKSTGTDFIVGLKGYLDGKVVNISVIPKINGSVSYWSLNEGSGTLAIDYLQNHNTGTLVDLSGITPINWIEGRFGKALRFDGSDDYVTIPDSPSLDFNKEITVSAWLNMNQLGTWSRWISKGKYTGPEEWFLISTWTFPYYMIKFTVFIGGLQYSSPDWAPPLNEWIHVVGKYDGSEVSLWVNGNKKTSYSVTGLIDSSSENMTMGYETGAGGSFANGIIDEVLIYNRALSSKEIEQIYRGEVAPGGFASVQILPIETLPSGKHTVTLCSVSQCNKWFITI